MEICSYEGLLGYESIFLENVAMVLVTVAIFFIDAKSYFLGRRCGGGKKFLNSIEDDFELLVVLILHFLYLFWNYG